MTARPRKMHTSPFLCYGAGKWFQYFYSLYKDTAIWNQCQGVIDRNVDLQGSDACGKAVLPPESLQRGEIQYVCVLITCKETKDIEDYIKAIDENIVVLKVRDIFANYSEISALKERIPSQFKFTEKPLIPRKIHYCWFGGAPLSELNAKCIASWREYCPDYQIIRWDESNYDVKKHPFMAAAYEARKWAFVSDYARLDIIFREGGIYLDTDVELIRSLDDLLYQKGYMAFDYRPKSFINTGLGFGAVANNEIIRYLRDEYDSIQFDYPKHPIEFFICPIIQSQSLINLGLKINGCYQILDEFSFYPAKILNGMNPYSMQVNCVSETFSVHHYFGSWLSK